MSCAVGVVQNGAVWIGADSFTAETGTVQIKRARKVEQCGRFLIACCGSGRYGQLVRHVFQPPKMASGQDLLNYLIRDFVTALQSVLDCNDVGYDVRGNARAASLIGVRGRLFELTPEMQIIEPARGYTAIGSGTKFALGALAVTSTVGTPEERIISALLAAEEHCWSVRRPFHVLKAQVRG